jgi:hypothetical protein
VKVVPAFAVAALATAVLHAAGAHAQARGASAKEAQEKGQHIEAGKQWVYYKGGLVPPSVAHGGPEALQRYIEIVSARAERDGAEQAMFDLTQASTEGADGIRRFLDASIDPGPEPTLANAGELAAWLRRVPGRFRIQGRIQMQQAVTAAGSMAAAAVLSGEINGLADCTGVGEGVGVQCILNATWPVIDLDVQRMDSAWRISPSERMKTMQPAMLVLGLNLDMPGIRALLVNDESIASAFTGGVTDDTLSAHAIGLCGADNDDCVSELQITAQPDSKTVSITLIKPVIQGPGVAYLPASGLSRDGSRRTPPAGKLIVTLTMHSDPEARVLAPMKTKKGR